MTRIAAGDSGHVAVHAGRRIALLIPQGKERDIAPVLETCVRHCPRVRSPQRRRA